MKTAQIARIRVAREEMLESYIDAIREAGGDYRIFLKEASSMSVAEMIDLLAQNGVRFHFDVDGRISK